MSKLGAAGRALVLAAVTGLPPALAQAQAPAPAKAASAAAEAAAAMERAQRLAANPMRVIIEAGKFKRKVVVDELPAEAADAASLRRTVARGNASAEPVLAVARPAADDTAAVPVPVPDGQPGGASAKPTIAITSSTLPGALHEAVPALETSAAPAVSVAPLPQKLPLLAALAAAKPSLLVSVEPVFAGRLADDAALLTEVLADLSLNPDGAVAQVLLLSPVPRALQRPIITALERWRFAPLPAQQTHRVQLVFNGR